MKFKRALGVLMCLVLACTCFAFSGCESKNAKYTVTVTASIDPATNETMGTVSIDPAQNTHKKNTTVTIRATKKPGYEFVNWTDENGEVIKIGELPATESYVFKITSNRVFKANFKKIIKATFDLNGGESATEIENSNNVPMGPLKLQVLTKTGYRFDGWRLNNGAIYSAPQSGEYVYNVTAQNVTDLNFVAVFTAKTYAPVLKVNGVSDNINSSNSYVLTYNEIMPKLPKCEDENYAYIWKRDGEPVVYEKWTEDIEDVSTLVFEADKVNAKTFLFEVGNKQYTYKVAETDALKTIKDALPSGALDKTGYDFVGFVLKGEEENEETNVYTQIQFDGTGLDEKTDILTNNLVEDGSEKATYVALFEIKSYNLELDEESSNYVTIVGSEGYGETINYNTTVNFTIEPKKQNATSDITYEINRVYYVDEQNNEKTLEPNNGVYTFNMPASNVTIKVDATAIYVVNFYDNGLIDTVNIKENATSIKVPNIDDDITREFIGWSLSDDTQDVLYDGKINNVTEFWNFVNAQQNKYQISLYAIWINNETGNVNFVGNKTSYGTDYTIIPAIESSGLLYNLKCNDQISLYDLLVQINGKANKSLTITKTYNNLSTEEKLNLLYYNVSQCLTADSQIYSQSVSYENELFLIKSAGEVPVKNMTAKVKIEIRDASGRVYSNADGAIDKETLQSIRADETTITFSVSEVSVNG